MNPYTEKIIMLAVWLGVVVLFKKIVLKNEKGVAIMAQKHNVKDKRNSIAGPQLQSGGAFVIEADNLGLFAVEVSAYAEDLSAIERLCLYYEQGLVTADGRSLQGACKELDHLADRWLALVTG